MACGWSSSSYRCSSLEVLGWPSCAVHEDFREEEMTNHSFPRVPVFTAGTLLLLVWLLTTYRSPSEHIQKHGRLQAGTGLRWESPRGCSQLWTPVLGRSGPDYLQQENTNGPHYFPSICVQTQTQIAVVPMYLNWTGESEEKRSVVMLLHIYPAQGAGQSVCCPGCEVLSGAPALQSPWAARSDHYPSDLTGEKRQKEKTNRKVKGRLWQRQSESRNGRPTGAIMI